LSKDVCQRSGVVKVSIRQVRLVDVGRVALDHTTLGIFGSEALTACNGSLLDATSLVFGSTVTEVGSLGVGNELLTLAELLLEVGTRVRNHQGGNN